MTDATQPTLKLLPVQIARALYYPTVMAAAIVALWWSLRLGATLAFAPYLAVLGAGLLVVLGEAIIPYRQAWRPKLREIVDDMAFMGFVQILLPLGLGWLAIWGVANLAAGSRLSLAVWPDHWPIWAQVLTKIAVGDFLRYWLHRWSHERPWLWRWHAPHHQPRKLYAANVFRFHPADKALQFMADTLPFILLGMGTEALAYYFVVYATSGFFQHSNCDIRLGPLNYLISGPELHRWHHSRDPSESNGNYGHTLILWDLLFGSYHRPKDRHVGDLGLRDPDYPITFLGQLIAPLRRTGSGA